MKKLSIIILILGLVSCQNIERKNKKSDIKIEDLETLAFEGISIDFQFNSEKPTFGDLFTIVGFKNPNFPPNSSEFEKLKDLGFEQTDDYFGIKNNTEKGDPIKLWLFPILNGEEVYGDNGPFDAIRITYVVVRNEIKNADLLEKTYNSLTSKLDVTPTFNGKKINKYADINQILISTIQYCRQELKVEPGSEKAMQLDW